MGIEDPRIEPALQHKLFDIITIAIYAVTIQVWHHILMKGTRLGDRPILGLPFSSIIAW